MQFNLFGKKFKCDTCGQKFKTETELEQHKIEHKGK
jgi:C2H2-type zinc finger